MKFASCFNKEKINLLGWQYSFVLFGIELSQKLRLHSLLETLCRLKHKMVIAFLENDLKAIIASYQERIIPISVQPNSGNGHSYKIFMLWLQGLQQAPILVRACIDAVRRNNPDAELVLLTNESIPNYISKIPDHIWRGYKNGEITKQTFSNILRVSLLNEFGGYWVDATLFTTKKMDEKIREYPFFSIKNQNGFPLNVSQRKWTTYFLYSKPDNILLSFILDSYNQYFINRKYQIDYWLFDYIIMVAYQNISSIKNMLDGVPENNFNVSNLMPLLNKRYDAEMYKKIIENTYLFKLDWRFKKNEEKDTFYNKLITKEF